MEKVIQIDGHNIGITNESTGTEIIRHNGIEVSRKFTLKGGTHIFTINENGSAVIFEICLKMAWHGFYTKILIKKNGLPVYTGDLSSVAAGIFGWAIWVLPLILAIVGNPSNDHHQLAMVSEYKKSNPYASIFIPSEVVNESCKYRSYLLFSTTENRLNICSVGYFWHVSVTSDPFEF